MAMLQILKTLDYDSLPISDYSRNYIFRLLPNLDYYLEIYHRCLHQMLDELGCPATDVIMVDYGGGHGFLSLVAKTMGIGKVIYVDANPQAVETVQAVSDKVGFGPDEMLLGDASALRQWCLSNNVMPNLLLGMDVIEHIYRLEDFFADLFSINPTLPMLFTTGSTPFNPYVVRKLHRVMQSDEMGHGGESGFHALRKRYILDNFPLMKDWEADIWATDTRGLTYPDIHAAVESHTPNRLADPYNTCDPATGSWTERILPIEAYQALLLPYHATLSVQNGFYNTHRQGVKGIFSRLLNCLPCCLFRPLAPFIILHISHAS